MVEQNDSGGFNVYFIDLEDFRRAANVSWDRRMLNLVHLDRSIGRFLCRAARLDFLYSYLGYRPDRAAARKMVAEVKAARDAIDRRKRARHARRPSASSLRSRGEPSSGVFHPQPRVRPSHRAGPRRRRKLGARRDARAERRTGRVVRRYLGRRRRIRHRQRGDDGGSVGDARRRGRDGPRGVHLGALADRVLSKRDRTRARRNSPMARPRARRDQRHLSQEGIRGTAARSDRRAHHGGSRAMEQRDDARGARLQRGILRQSAAARRSPSACRISRGAAVPVWAYIFFEPRAAR